ncbi:helix-turn-helix domain-containing protein [Clostridium thermobutyricum]
MDIGSQIKILRKENKLTLKELSKKIGISYVNLSRIENNKAIPRPSTLKKIADVFDVEFKADKDNLIFKYFSELQKKDIDNVLNLILSVNNLDLNYSDEKLRTILTSDFIKDTENLIRAVIKAQLLNATNK